MNASLQGNGLSAAYYRDSNRLYLSNDAGNGWIGWCTPGAAQTLSNSYVLLDCGETAVSGLDNTMTIHWRVTPLSPFSGSTGSYQVYLRAMDMDGARSTWQSVGSWVLGDGAATPTATSDTPPTSTPTATPTSPSGGNAPPLPGDFSPDGGSGTVNQEHNFVTTYQDGDGAADLRAGYFLMNVGLQGGGLSAVYYQTSNRFYLANDAGNGWVGVCVAGTANTLSNSFVNLDCAGSSASGDGDTLTIMWAITPTAPFSGSYGLYQVYLRAMDMSGERSSWTPSGTWTLLEQ